MNKRLKNFILCNVCGIILIVVSLLVMKGYVYRVNLREVEYKMGQPEGECSLQIEKTKEWPEDAHGYRYGIQYDVLMVNQTDFSLRDWTAQILVPTDCVIDSYWNAEVTIDNGVIIATPVVYNKVIEPNGERDMGFILYSNDSDSIKDFTIRFYKLISVEDIVPFWLMILAVILGGIADISFVVSEIRTRSFVAKQQEYKHILKETFLTFARMIDAKDPYTKGHSYRVARYSMELAKRLGQKEEEQEYIFYIALLHDIGKIGIPDTILKKNGKLDPEERSVIETHVTLGGDILSSYTAIQGVSEGARFHHERYDGSGYVSGLKGEEIPLVARIICVADAFDAMTSNRCYRKAQSIEWVIEELRTCSGKQFDPTIVPHMIAMIEDGVAPISSNGLEEGA